MFLCVHIYIYRYAHHAHTCIVIYCVATLFAFHYCGFGLMFNFVKTLANCLRIYSIGCIMSHISSYNIFVKTHPKITVEQFAFLIDLYDTCLGCLGCANCKRCFVSRHTKRTYVEHLVVLIETSVQKK